METTATALAIGVTVADGGADGAGPTLFAANSGVFVGDGAAELEIEEALGEASAVDSATTAARLLSRSR